MEEDEIVKHNEKIIEENKKDFESFVDAIHNNKCDICKKNIDYFNENEICLHWLLKPAGVDKKHISMVLRNFEYGRVEAYLRWLANSESIFKNINDLVEEGASEKVIEQTIKYKDIEWSFSSAKSDFFGHKDTYKGSNPHYHFQMIIDKNIFFRYGDEHINFSSADLLMFKIKKNEIPGAKFHSLSGSGMQEIMSSFSNGELLDMMTNTDDYENATFRTQSLIIAKEGEKISGDMLVDIFKESKEKNVPIASLLYKIETADKDKSQIFITPGDGVPQKAIRTPKNRGKNKK